MLAGDAMLGLDVWKIVGKQPSTAVTKSRILVLGFVEFFLDAVVEVDHGDANLSGKMAMEPSLALGSASAS
ncbi:hypothetical protein PG984_014356 [Apiospora sp. TS-2023a]